MEKDLDAKTVTECVMLENDCLVECVAGETCRKRRIGRQDKQNPGIEFQAGERNPRIQIQGVVIAIKNQSEGR